MNEQIFIGIDLAKDTFCVCLPPAAINLSMPNSTGGIRQSVKALGLHNVKLVVFEATGGYECPIVAGLLEGNFKAVITACIRKLLIILNTMMRNETSWKPKNLK
jgi:transposase